MENKEEVVSDSTGGEKQVEKEEGLLEKLRKYCDSDEMETEFSTFAQKHFNVFVNNLEFSMHSTDDVPHEFHEVYSEYLLVFEAKLEGFLTENDSSLLDFREECENAIDKPGIDKFFIQSLYAAIEFDFFVEMMIEEVRKQQRAK